MAAEDEDEERSKQLMEIIFTGQDCGNISRGFRQLREDILDTPGRFRVRVREELENCIF